MRLPYIFNNKGQLSGIAEKALKNGKRYYPNKDDKRESSIAPERLRYFTFGHAMKHLDKQVFNIRYNEEGKPEATSFVHFRNWISTGDPNIYNLVENIRNINSHYLHKLDKIKIDTTGITYELYQIILEAFQIAVKQIYSKQKKDDTTEVLWLFNQYYNKPKKRNEEDSFSFNERKKEWEKQKETFLQRNLEQASDFILSIEVKSDEPWIHEQTSLQTPLSRGRYLSFYGCLFVLSTFLYKHEAHQLISRIKGFKKNENKQDRSKLKIYEFFAKRYTSQDVDSEEKNLVYFHGLIVYLNRFPVVWNREFDAIAAGQPIPTDLTDLCEYLNPQQEDDPMGTIPKIGQIVALQGRNRDRFLLFAARYMAETEFFGKEVLFKCYKDYETSSADDLSGKYHKGRLVHFVSWNQHKTRFPYWDTPFVIQQESLQIQIPISGSLVTIHLQREIVVLLLRMALFPKENEKKGKELLEEYYSLQRKERNNLIDKLPTRANDALYSKLLPKKLVGCYIERNSNPINPYLQLLERTEKSESRYRLLYERAQAEDRVEDFNKSNKGLRYKLDFVRKAWHYMSFRPIYEEKKEQLSARDQRKTSDKGHHRSLHFTREEFNEFSRLMYRMEYPECKTALKRLFQTKGFLDDRIFEQEFGRADSLNQLYELTHTRYQEWLSLPNRSNTVVKTEKSLDSYLSILEKPILYINFQHFRTFAKQDAHPELDANADRLIQPFYNVPSVTASIPKGEKRPNWKVVSAKSRTLHQKLFSAKCEDALLYELAFRYRPAEEALSGGVLPKVENIFTEDIFTPIVSAQSGKTLYYLQTPFSKIESLYAELDAKKMEEKRKGKESFLTNIPDYLALINKEPAAPSNDKTPNYKDIVDVAKKWETGEKRNGLPILTQEDLYQIRNHILKFANKISRMLLQLEQEHLLKPEMGQTIHEFLTDPIKLHVNLNRTFKYIDIRKTSMHFGLPKNISYISWYYKLIKENETLASKST